MTITVEGPGGATVEFPDGTSAETINSVMTEHFGGGQKKEEKTPSGVIAGAAHGATDIAEGIKETAKRFAGVGPGRKDDPNYVPANVTNGSWDPTKWNLSQLPQKVAEMAPDVGAGAIAGTAAKSLARAPGWRGKALAALIGAGLYGMARSAGDTAKEVTVARTGDENAPSSTADLVRAGLTSAAASVPDALLPTRFVPGLSKAVGPGLSGVGQAALRQLGTAAVGGAGNVASDAIQQVGTTIGTDKGLTIDPSRFPEAAVSGAATGATLGVPKALLDAKRAVSLREHGGENLEATKNYSTRLNTEGQGQLGDKLIGAGLFDQQAHDNAVFGIQRELSDAGKNVRRQLPGLSQEADNVLAKAESNKPLTAADIDLLDKSLAGAPDGANAAYLARTMRMSQLAAERGQNGGKSGWTGGISGVADANVGYMLNPFRMATGAAMAAGGAHLLGVGNPWFAGTALGLYGAARLVDAAAGTRSPAKTYAEHFADANAKLRLPPTGPAAAPAPSSVPNGPWNPAPRVPYGVPGTQVNGMRPAQAPGGPWGPRPLPTTTVPQVAAPQAPAPITPGTAPWKAPQITDLPQFKALQLKMLAEKLKQGLPPEPQAPAPPPQPAPINPLMLPRDITGPAKALSKGMADVHAMKQAEQAKAAVSSLDSPLMEDAPLDVTRNPQIGKRASQLVSAANALKKYTGADVAEKEAAAAEKAQAKLALAALKAKPRAAASLNSAASPMSMAQILQNVTAEVTAPKKIKKVNGKVEAEAPKAPEPPKAPEFEPFDPEGDPRVRYQRGISAKEYGEAEAARAGTSNERYKGNAAKTASDWIKTTNMLSAKFPGYKRSFEAVLHHLINIGSNVETRRAAIEHFAGHVPDDVAQAMRESYK